MNPNHQSRQFSPQGTRNSTPAAAPSIPAPPGLPEGEDAPSLRYRVVVPLRRTDKEGKERTYWHRVGTAFTNRDERGGSYISLKLDSFPLGGEANLFVDDARHKGKEEGE